EVDEAPSRKRRGPYAKSTRQRDTIIRTALGYFGQYGYHGASMREIARQVGLSQAGLLHHFPTKADLLTAVLESRDTLSESAGRAASYRGDHPLAVMIYEVADNARQRPLVQMLSTVSPNSTYEDYLAHSLFRRRSRTVLRHMRRGVEAAIAQGLLRADL